MSDWRELLSGYRLASAAPSRPERAGEPLSVVTDAMRSSGLSRAVAEARSRGCPLTFVLNDSHRFTDSRVFLDAFFELVGEDDLAGIPLRALFAAGTHIADAGQDAAHERKMFGPWRQRLDAVEWHDARATDQLKMVGGTLFHPWMAEAGVYLACGSMEPHYFAGVTGAHKTLTVGVMAYESIQANHAHAMEAEASGLRLEGNPVHLGIVDALADLEDSGAHVWCVDQVVIDGQVAACTAGHPLEALAKGLPIVERCFAYCTEEPADLLVSCVGPPLDRDVYQADKGIKNTEGAVRDGGVLLVEAGCAHGVGIDHFVQLLRAASTYAEALKVVGARGYRLGDHKAVRLRQLTDARGVRVGLIAAKGALDSALAGPLGFALFEDRESALLWAREQLGDGPRGCLLVEDAGNLTVTCRQSAGGAHAGESHR